MIKCYEGWSQCNDYDSHFLKFEPFIVRQALNRKESQSCLTGILDKLCRSSHRVDISYTTNASDDYNGNPLKRECLDVKIKDFIEAFGASSKDNPHWLLDLGMYFFLSQCTLYSPTDASTQEILDVDVCDDIPPFMKEVIDLETINLWINLYHASTTLHYDANHNFLLVLSGQKKVTLISPCHSDKLKPFHASSEFPNHSHLTVTEVNEFINQQMVADGTIFEINVHDGDLLFIPEGWWHQVTSSRLTVALNSWFKSSFSKLVSTDCTHNLPYFTRAIIHKMANSHSIDNEIQEDISDQKQKRQKIGEVAETLLQFSAMIENILVHGKIDSRMHLTFVQPPLNCIETLWIPYGQQVLLEIISSYSTLTRFSIFDAPTEFCKASYLVEGLLPRARSWISQELGQIGRDPCR